MSFKIKNITFEFHLRSAKIQSNANTSTNRKGTTKISARAAILRKLHTGRAYTITELAREAKTTKTEIQGQLDSLTKMGILVTIERRKRNYYWIANEEIAQGLQDHLKRTGVIKDDQETEEEPVGMKYCRTCYHHLAGKVGVLLTERLLQKKNILKLMKKTISN